MAAGTLTGPLALPYSLGLQAAAPGPHAPASAAVGMLVAEVLFRNLALLAPVAAVGLLLARRIGLGAPYLESRLDGSPPPARPWSSIVRPALSWAAVTALLAFGVDALFVHALGVRFPAPEIHARIDVAWWRSGLASLWAPFAEEILDRLFLLSLLAWLGMKLLRVRGAGRPRTAALWGANLLTALFFAWYHIANERLWVIPVPPIVALRTVLIVLPVGLALGWLYLRRGLEAAILSHFAIDVIVHVVRPLIERRLV